MNDDTKKARDIFLGLASGYSENDEGARDTALNAASEYFLNADNRDQMIERWTGFLQVTGALSSALLRIAAKASDGKLSEDDILGMVAKV